MTPGLLWMLSVKSAAKVRRNFELTKHFPHFFHKKAQKTKKTKLEASPYLNFFVILHAVL
jgi:hypothetical protein